MISKNAEYWIWFTLAIGFNTPKAKKLSELYPDISVFYNGGIKEWRLSGIFTDREVNRLSEASLTDAEGIIEKSRVLGHSIMTIDDKEYPRCLYNIYSPPAVLYVNGDIPMGIDNRFTVGIVGTRKASQYGIRNAYQIGLALSKYGVATVSGGALGVDCAAHRGSLSADGITVCVLGCGLNYNYLSQNADMRKQITKRGAVISEYPPDEQPRKHYFPARNRIIAALSKGIVIIESGKNSGSLITADLALEQGKDVFALLGDNTPQNEGSNARIKEGTAVPITDFIDILNHYDGLYVTDESLDLNFDEISFEDIDAVPVKSRTAQRAIPINDNKLRHKADNKPMPEKRSVPKKNQKTASVVAKVVTGTEKPKVHRTDLDLNDTERSVYHMIGTEPVHIDEIAGKLKLPVFKVSVALSRLELFGAVKAVEGRRFILN